MLEKMMEKWVLVTALLTTVFSWSISWILVSKLGWRYEGLLGNTFSQSESFVAYMVFSGLIYSIAIPVALAFLPSRKVAKG